MEDAYEFGCSVRVSGVEPYKWYTIAASGDNPLAARVKDLLVEKMSPDQFTGAKRLVAEWEPIPADCEVAGTQVGE